MADTNEELANLNNNARLLLEKYDGVFAQLDEQSKQALIDIANKSDEGLQVIQTLLDNGSVAEAENALKLGGKTLDEITGTVIQIYHYKTNVRTELSSAQETSDDLTANSGVKWISFPFTPKRSDSKLILISNIISLAEDSNGSDSQFALAKYDDTLIGVAMATVGHTAYKDSMNASFSAFNHSFLSWGADEKEIEIRVGQRGDNKLYVNTPTVYTDQYQNFFEIGFTIMEVSNA